MVTIRSADKNRGRVKAARYHCEDCGADLEEPLADHAFYVWRPPEPVLVCRSCLRPTDGYIWGPLDVLDPRDHTPEEIQAIVDREKATQAALEAQAAFQKNRKQPRR